MTKTFIRITNKDIYNKIEELIEHQKITNGKIKLNSFMSRLSITLCLLIISSLLVGKFI